MSVLRFESGTSPLALALRRFAGWLAECGYTARTQEHYLASARGFARFAVKRRIELRELLDDHVEEFARTDTAGRRYEDGGHDARRDRRNPLRRFLAMLRDEGVVPPAAPAVEILGPRVADYVEYAREHLGLSESTLRKRRRMVGAFLAAARVRTEDDLRRVGVEQIDAHLVAESRRLAKESMGSVSTAVRGFLGFLYTCGFVAKDLRSYVPRPRLYKLARMPRSVAWADVRRTLDAIDRRTTLGRRDYAMLMLVACCGLRAGDVAALRLKDLDWRHDVIHARRPKTRSREDVPLVDDVGEALIAYLRRRPASRHDAVFLTVNAPPRPLAADCIGTRAAKYMHRAGVRTARYGSYTLRHSQAVELLRQGRSLKEIGDVLGHTHPQTTYLYAKADVEQLRQVGLDVDRVLPVVPETDVEQLREIGLDVASVLPRRLEHGVDEIREVALDVETVLP